MMLGSANYRAHTELSVIRRPLTAVCRRSTICLYARCCSVERYRTRARRTTTHNKSKVKVKSKKIFETDSNDSCRCWARVFACLWNTHAHGPRLGDEQQPTGRTQATAPPWTLLVGAQGRQRGPGLNKSLTHPRTDNGPQSLSQIMSARAHACEPGQEGTEEPAKGAGGGWHHLQH